MQIAVFSDIHANLSAMSAVLRHCGTHYPGLKDVVVLGDLVNYGPRPNETIAALRDFLDGKVLHAALAGNHEMELLRESPSARFSSDRGVAALRVTAALVSEESRAYLRDRLRYGPQDFRAGGRRILCVHACLTDPYWGKMSIDELRRVEYAAFDFVLSGHTHVPHLYEEFFEGDDPRYRNRKKVTFVNPGSVGQPRNQVPLAHYAVLEPETSVVHFNKVPFDIDAEVAAYEGAGFDPFYSERLRHGV